MTETQIIRAHIEAKIVYHHDIEVAVPLAASEDEVMTALRARGNEVFANVCQTAQGISPEISLTLIEDKKPTQLAYAYMVSLTTHQLLHQDVVIESAHPLSKEALVERALESAWKGDWEADKIDPSIDIDEIQTLRKGAN